MRNLTLILSALLVGLISTSAVYGQSGSGTGSGSASGSASGSGALSCENLGCSHGCNETSMGPMCYCPTGYELGEEGLTCQVCRGGYWGMGCSMMCQCGPGGSGNPCNNVNGACICNSCWTGTQCTISNGSDCFLEFLQEPDKALEILTQRYGGDPFPQPDHDTITGLIATSLMEVESAAIIANPVLTLVDRTEVQQGPLAKLTWTVDYTVNRPEAEAGLTRLLDKVKLGNLRVTIIEQGLTNKADITVNAGTKI